MSHSDCYSDPENEERDSSPQPQPGARVADSTTGRSSTRRGVVGDEDVTIVFTDEPMPRETSRVRASETRTGAAQEQQDVGDDDPPATMEASPTPGESRSNIEQSTANDAPSAPPPTAHESTEPSQPPVQPEVAAPATASRENPPTLSAVGPREEDSAFTHADPATPATPATYAEFIQAQPVMGIPIEMEAPRGRREEEDQEDDHPPMTPVLTPGPGSTVIVRLPSGLTVSTAEALQQIAENEERLTLAWTLGRTIRIWSVMDAVTVCVWMIMQIWFAALVAFPLIGLVGAKRYNPRAMMLYLCYFPIVIPLRGWVSWSAASDQRRDSVVAVYYGLCAIAILVEMWLAHKVYKAYKMWSALPDEALLMLLGGWTPSNAVDE